MHRSARRIDSSGRKGSLGAGMKAFTAVAMQANCVQSNYLETMVTFDANSVPVGVDNRCTGCTSNRIEDFEGPMVESNRATKGFGGSRTAGMMTGTLAWRWMDNAGRVHKFLIPKSFHVKGGNVRPLSPQHWAQTQKDTKLIQGTGSETDARQVTLFWNQRKNKLTIPLAKSDNVATFLSAAGCQKQGHGSLCQCGFQWELGRRGVPQSRHRKVEAPMHHDACRLPSQLEIPIANRDSTLIN
jgi:hypothetical protein